MFELGCGGVGVGELVAEDRERSLGDNKSLTPVDFTTILTMGDVNFFVDNFFLCLITGSPYA